MTFLDSHQDYVRTWFGNWSEKLNLQIARDAGGKLRDSLERLCDEPLVSATISHVKSAPVAVCASIYRVPDIISRGYYEPRYARYFHERHRRYPNVGEMCSRTLEDIFQPAVADRLTESLMSGRLRAEANLGLCPCTTYFYVDASDRHLSGNGVDDPSYGTARLLFPSPDDFESTVFFGDPVRLTSSRIRQNLPIDYEILLSRLALFADRGELVAYCVAAGHATIDMLASSLHPLEVHVVGPVPLDRCTGISVPVGQYNQWMSWKSSGGARVPTRDLYAAHIEPDKNPCVAQSIELSVRLLRAIDCRLEIGSHDD